MGNSPKARLNPLPMPGNPWHQSGMTQDILIIGGGIAGLSLAARLAPHASVTLLEAEDALAYHASGRSAALYEQNYGAPAVLGLARASAQFYLEETDYLSPRGLMLLGKAGAEEAFERERKKWGQDLLTPDEARQILPFIAGDVTQVGYHAEAWDIDTDRMMQDHAKELRAHGGTVALKSRVSGIEKADGLWRVTCGDTVFEAKILVNAAGAWVDEVAALAGITPLGFTPLRRSMARIPAPDGVDPSSWPMVFGAGDPWYMKPDAGALIVSPEEEDPAEPHDAWADDMVLAEGLARFDAHLDIEVTRLLSNWAGLRTFSPDRVLTIGASPEDPTFFWQAGQGGYGFITAPAASQLGADLILGRAPALDPALVTALSPERFA